MPDLIGWLLYSYLPEALRTRLKIITLQDRTP